MSKNHTVNLEDFAINPLFEVPLASIIGGAVWKKLYALVNVLSGEVTYQVDTRNSGLSCLSLPEAIEEYNSTEA